MRLRLGTRRSDLAMAQSGMVARSLEEAHEGLEVELVPITTLGDRTPGDLAKVGGKGLFTQELEEKLRSGEIDLAVHSLKDLPVHLPDGLSVAAYPERADPRDALLSLTATSLDELPPGARLLTGSLRRKALLLAFRSDLQIVPVRGNIQTRIRKWQEQGADGVILAAAGLERLPSAAGDLPTHPLDPEIVIPAPGQGTLAVETANDTQAAELCAAIDHAPSAREAAAERAVVEAFGGDCTLPLAAWCRPGKAAGELVLAAFLSTPDGSDYVLAKASHENPAALASSVVESMRSDGAERILAKLPS